MLHQVHKVNDDVNEEMLTIIALPGGGHALCFKVCKYISTDIKTVIGR